jgi:DNA-binding GntR family transcriptional regulator
MRAGRRAAAKDEQPALSGSTPRLYQRVFEILADQIAQGELATAPLTETAVATRFGISRAPARRALAELEQAGVIEKAEPRGYRLTGRPAGRGAAAREWPIAEAEHRLVPSPSWERIYGEVESEIIARISFASWRVNEAMLARHYHVSRTVARDVVGRLQQRGVIRKDARSRWYAPALTPGHVGELYELRWLLEPVALTKAASKLPPGVVEDARRHLLKGLEQPEKVAGATLDALERELHVGLLGYCGNATLMQAITLPQSLLIAHRFLYRWTARLFPIEPFLPEHLEVLDRLGAGRVREAAKALESHLKVSRERAIARVDAIAQGAQPDPLSYLERLASPG